MGIKAPLPRKQREPEVSLLCGLLVRRQAAVVVYWSSPAHDIISLSNCVTVPTAQTGTPRLGSWNGPRSQNLVDVSPSEESTDSAQLNELYSVSIMGQARVKCQK